MTIHPDQTLPSDMRLSGRMFNQTKRYRLTQIDCAWAIQVEISDRAPVYAHDTLRRLALAEVPR